MISFILNCLKIILLLGMLVFIHEAGHFIIAKLCRIKVNEFALGFGPTILKKQGKETKYALRLIPLGGFVSMEGEEERSDNEGSFSKAIIPKRIAIIAAGGTVNIIFAIILYFCVSLTNVDYYTNIIENIPEGSYIEQAGIMKNDEILKINNKGIVNNNDIQKVLSKVNEENITVQIKRNRRKNKL